MPAQWRLRLALTLLLVLAGAGCSARSDAEADDTVATVEDTAAAATAEEEAADEDAAPEESPAAREEASAEPDSVPTPRLTPADLDVYLRGKRAENPELAKRCKDYVALFKSSPAALMTPKGQQALAALSEDDFTGIGSRAADVDARSYTAITRTVERLIFLWADYTGNKDDAKKTAAGVDSLRREFERTMITLGEDANNTRVVLSRIAELEPVFRESRGARPLSFGCKVDS